jgi:hypothetical protein
MLKNIFVWKVKEETNNGMLKCVTFFQLSMKNEEKNPNFQKCAVNVKEKLIIINYETKKRFLIQSLGFFICLRGGRTVKKRKIKYISLNL